MTRFSQGSSYVTQTRIARDESQTERSFRGYMVRLNKEMRSRHLIYVLIMPQPSPEKSRRGLLQFGTCDAGVVEINAWAEQAKAPRYMKGARRMSRWMRLLTRSF